MVFSRLTICLAALWLIATPQQSALAETDQHQSREKHHGLSLITPEPDLPPDFPHFPYANPEAPTGGTATMAGIGTYDSFNPITFKGTKAAGLEGLLYERLMASDRDNPSTQYGLIAEWVSYPEDYSSVTFKLREDARFHDGEPITPEDVIFSMKVSREHDPQRGAYFANIDRVEQTGEHKVTFHFDVSGNRELPFIVGQLYVYPKHYWDGSEDRNPSETTLEPPVGSGPYRIGKFEAGRNLVYERVEDYWGGDLNVRKGHHNFDRVAFEYFRDRTVAFEAFKAGKIDFYIEQTAKNWATGYDFPALNRGDVVKRTVDLDVPAGMQSFAFNIRRERFADRRVRRAFNHAFNFEWINKQIFFGQYERTDSFFENSELASRGLPEGQERQALEKLRQESPEYVPEEVLTKEYFNPEGGERRILRGNLREALRLFREAGWKTEQGRLINAETGEQFSVEFLLDSPSFERVVLPYKQTLERIGMDVSVRTVDTAQYQQRVNTFDFDVIVHSFGQSNSPGNEQRFFWGSKAADREGSANVIGIKNPAVDELIDQIIFAKDRDELVAMTRALDRVLLWNHYVVPQWFLAAQRIAYWKQFEHPERLPERSVGFPAIWWHAPEGGKRASTAQ